MTAADWPALAPDVAAALERGPLADRPRREVREHGGRTVRYGRRGSLRLTVTGPAAGTWTDHEAGASGGVLALLIHLGAADSARDAADWLRRHGVNAPESPYRPPNGATPARSTPTGQNRRPGRARRAPDANSGPDRRALALLAGSAAIPVAADHPARRWLDARALWRPGVNLPPWMRWISADTLADVGGAVRPGPAMAGALIVPAAPLDAWLAAVPDWPRAAVAGVQLVNVAADGAPALDAPTRADPLNKRSYGRMAGAVAAVGVLDVSAGVTLAEGVADALALAARFRPAAVAAFGTGGLSHPATARALASIQSVTVYPDADLPKRGPDGRLRRAGHAAAEELRLAIERHGGRLRRVDLPDGCDVADLATRDGWRDVDADVLNGWRVALADGRQAWECDRLAYAVAAECAAGDTLPTQDAPPAP